MKKLQVLDLFSGIGGFSLGFHRTGGFETSLFCEIDLHAQKVLKKNFPQVPIWGDIKTLDEKFINFITDKPIDVICGGFPCQDISVAGLQKGLIDDKGNTTRSGLWFEYKRFIGELKPRYVIIENVANLRSKGLVTVLQDLWALGYDAEWNIISARSLGACHLRERLWVIAYPNREGLQRRFLIDRDRDRVGGAEKQRLINGSSNEKTPAFAPYPDDIRLRKPFTSEKEKSERWTETASRFRNWWEIESSICRMDDGLPRKLDKYRAQRIKQLGNTIVPHAAELIGQAILDYETSQN